MRQSQDANRDDNLYMVDHESAAEMSRLLDQDRLYTRAMGGLLSERANQFTDIEQVLDVGCGPGGWAQEVAFAHRDIEVKGIDISKTMIRYARAQAKVQTLKNLDFQIMDITKQLNFPADSFDLVNARLLGFFLPTFWPQLMQEYMRITRPGGIIRLTETEMSVSTSPAVEQEHAWFFRSLMQAGQSFSVNGERLTLTTKLAPLLRQAGCQNVKVTAHALDWSYGSEAHYAMCKNMRLGFKLVEPFYLSMQLATQKELDQTFEQMLVEIEQDDFCAVHYLLSAYGEKPA